MYYSWGQWPYYTAVPVYRSDAAPHYPEGSNLQEQFEELRKEWQDLRQQILQWETKIALLPARSETDGQAEQSELLKRLEEQISNLRTEQIAAYNQLLNQFLTNHVSNHFRELQKDITPEKVVGRASFQMRSAQTDVDQTTSAESN
ncbi:hypothetical protein [Effusibacillus pohliae]|uniref:hypothetical protein n=1 Tax=Effusibacillus pohliae TaxID=232270 RepID=UPI00035F4FCF|nr:hypothetical protein [Effusibacillus pohliae]